MEPAGRQAWHHAPLHRFIPGTAYMVTAGTHHKALLFDRPRKLRLLEQALFRVARKFDWRLQAWALMANHYQFIAVAPEDPSTLKRLVAELHSRTARELNLTDGTPGRKVWFEYWDTCLTYEKSYFARLHYVHQNPVKHGLVTRAEDYPWCSMAWFLDRSRPAYRRQVLSFRVDKLSVKDPY